MAAISESFEAYGYRRMQTALRHRGLITRRSMREHGLQPRRRRRYIATTDGDHELPIFPNLAQLRTTFSCTSRSRDAWATLPQTLLDQAHRLDLELTPKLPLRHTPPPAS